MALQRNLKTLQPMLQAMGDRKPSKEELLAAAGKTVPDVIAHGLQLLFCGINPGLYTAAVGHHFARPGNRFWPALLKASYSITNLVARATTSASELSNEEYVRRARILEKKILRYNPKCIAFLGVGAYRAAFGRHKAVIGRQDERLGGALIWTLPNPSGLNANYRLDDLARLFAELREAVAG